MWSSSSLLLGGRGYRLNHMNGTSSTSAGLRPPPQASNLVVGDQRYRSRASLSQLLLQQQEHEMLLLCLRRRQLQQYQEQQHQPRLSLSSERFNHLSYESSGLSLPSLVDYQDSHQHSGNHLATMQSPNTGRRSIEEIEGSHAMMAQDLVTAHGNRHNSLACTKISLQEQHTEKITHVVATANSSDNKAMNNKNCSTTTTSITDDKATHDDHSAPHHLSTAQQLDHLGRTVRLANEPYVDVAWLPDLDSPSVQHVLRCIKGRGGVQESYPSKLHRMLSDAENSMVVSFMPHGRAFRIHNRQVFEDSVMPRYFPKVQFKSILRQLYLYGFRRISEGPDTGAYYHELFLRNRSSTCMFMRRLPVGKTKRGDDCRKIKTTAPDFYQMPPLPPSTDVFMLPYGQQFL